MGTSDWWGHGFGFMWLIPLLFLAVFVILVSGIFGQGLGGSANSTQPASAREILDQRFAKGEINTDEYEAKKKALGGGQ